MRVSFLSHPANRTWSVSMAHTAVETNHPRTERARTEAIRAPCEPRVTIRSVPYVPCAWGEPGRFPAPGRLLRSLSRRGSMPRRSSRSAYLRHVKERVKKAHLLVLAGAAVAGLLLAFGSPASGGSGANAAKAKRVGVRDNSFTPKTTRVAVGGKVTWTWKGVGDHNVTFRKVPGGASKRGARTRSSGSFTRSFTKKGTYRYVCTIHVAGGMTGRVIAG